MPPRFATILERLRQDLAAGLSPRAITEACKAVGHRWRDGVLNPVTTVYLFLLQVLHGNTACQHVVHFGGWTFSASAYCQARKRLPLALWQRLLEATTARLRRSTEPDSRWRGHRVWVVDGSSFSMPDVPELQRHFGQPPSQRPGCGFPLAKLLAVFDLSTGMLLRIAASPFRTHEASQLAAVHAELAAGDVLLGDRGFCSFAHLALLVQRGAHGVFRLHQRQLVDFRPGRGHVPPGRSANPDDLPRSRWVRALGGEDQVVAWFKPKRRPQWITPEEFAALPGELVVRELRYRVEVAGFRTRSITLATTLLDAEAYPAAALAELYRWRWRIETDLKHLKITMNMDVLRCETVEGVLKEMTVFALAYNLVRSVMIESAAGRGVTVERISLVDAVRWLVGREADADRAVLHVNPSRPDRFEPRVVKRRPKQYRLMNRPRAELRKRLSAQGDAA
jgi:DDE family transposase